MLFVFWKQPHGPLEAVEGFEYGGHDRLVVERDFAPRFDVVQRQGRDRGHHVVHGKLRLNFQAFREIDHLIVEVRGLGFLHDQPGLVRVGHAQTSHPFRVDLHEFLVQPCTRVLLHREPAFDQPGQGGPRLADKDFLVPAFAFGRSIVAENDLGQGVSFRILEGDSRGQGSFRFHVLQPQLLVEIRFPGFRFEYFQFRKADERFTYFPKVGRIVVFFLDAPGFFIPLNRDPPALSRYAEFRNVVNGGL